MATVTPSTQGKSMNRNNVLIGQSGGPTSVINASLAGVVQRVSSAGGFGSIYGMRYGIQGFLQEQLIDLGREPESTIEGLRSTPGSALGSCRYRMTDADLPRVRSLMEVHEIGTFFLIGGNDTMETIHRVEEYCRTTGYPLTCIGIPKTVDNDLYGTDHVPGFASAARYIALSVQQAGRLANDMQKVDRFTVFQTIGREAGWLAASSILARQQPDDAPHLIYLPERAINRDRMVADVKSTIASLGWCFIVIGEGTSWEDGTPVSASTVADGFSNTEFGAMSGSSAALNLHRIIAEETGMRGEFQITESLPMCAIDRASTIDLEEAYLCGVNAVEFARSGKTGVMVSIARHAGSDYSIEYTETPLSEVAVMAKPMPDEYINTRGNGVTSAFVDYIRPLVGEMPTYSVLGHHSQGERDE
jgi:ATP-dependent phosphofructokinase / diphosphate-dependent phosphofructokinase